MKTTLLLSLLCLLAHLQAGEPENATYKTFKSSYELPRPYNECELFIECNKSGHGDLFVLDSSRTVSRMELLTLQGTIDLKTDLQLEIIDPSYPVVSYFLTKEGLAVFINMDSYTHEFERSKLIIKVLHHQVDDFSISKIDALDIEE